MSGRIEKIYQEQIDFQKKVIKAEKLPYDAPAFSSYHTLALVEEVGEVLKADKRWKTHRNTFYDPANKLEELADVLITTLNIGIFSGFTVEEILEAVEDKIKENNKRLFSEK